MISLLDTSLRDGGHRTNFDFSDEDLQEILPALDASHIDYIEIGYRNGSLQPITQIGRAGLCDKHYVQYCRSLVKKALLAVMAYPKNIQQHDLDELKELGVDMLRLCVAKDQLARVLPLIIAAKKLHFKVALNFISITSYTNDELAQLVGQAVSYEPDIVYFADSNGSILPHQVTLIYEQMHHQYPELSLGFHAHDNIGLAQANAMAAVQAGAQFIDASLSGMGKGIGNLKTEFFIAYLHAVHVEKYNLTAALYAANYVRQALKIGHELIEMDEFLRGITNSSQYSR